MAEDDRNAEPDADSDAPVPPDSAAAQDTVGDATSDDATGADEAGANAAADDEATGADEAADDEAAANEAADDEAGANEAAANDEAGADTSPPPVVIPDGPSRASRLIMVAVVTGVLLALDLVTKQWAWDNLKDQPGRMLIEGWAYLEFGFNTGSAFSLLRDASWSRMLFIGITVLALLYMAHLARNLPTRFGSAFVAIAMVASGALGNLHDRFFRMAEVGGEMRHGVVDFIRLFYWKGKAWPTFNVADVALVAGVLLLLIFLLRHGDVLDAPDPEADA
ncbi:MAG: signal peptidase II [Deltaproteobacteria bacterium]|nr:signal peptidase II [Deltaproteobacteria bacterium]